MSTTFRLDMHPASEGDCLTLTWGETEAPRRALVDFGRRRDYERLSGSLASRYDLVVVTHIDADHIDGAMPFVAETRPNFEPGEIWFNAYHHLVEARDARVRNYETFAPDHGERLSAGIVAFGWRDRWNTSFGGGRVSVSNTPPDRPIELAGATIRLLSPTDAGLARLEPVWAAAVGETAIDRAATAAPSPGPGGVEIFAPPSNDVETLMETRWSEDRTPPNGSSIAFLVEYDGRRVLLLADAHPSVIATSLRTLGASPEHPMRVDLVKVSHHGSKANTSMDLLALIDCGIWAFSTDGSRHGHPNGESVARVLTMEARRRALDPARAPTTLVFNFDQPHTRIWNVAAAMRRHDYRCVFPETASGGVSIEI